jgi:hypothetical protein
MLAAPNELGSLSRARERLLRPGVPAHERPDGGAEEQRVLDDHPVPSTAASDDDCGDGEGRLVDSVFLRELPAADGAYLMLL